VPDRPEAFTNIVKHASASSTEVRVHVGEDRIAIAVRDNGTGFDPSVRSRGFGVAGMREVCTWRCRRGHTPKKLVVLS
jgi:two-component system sensor histidine kinase UhpB